MDWFNQKTIRKGCLETPNMRLSSEDFPKLEAMGAILGMVHVLLLYGFA
jgi:hypothetical protein